MEEIFKGLSETVKDFQESAENWLKKQEQANKEMDEMMAMMRKARECEEQSRRKIQSLTYNLS